MWWPAVRWITPEGWASCTCSAAPARTCCTSFRTPSATGRKVELDWTVTAAINNTPGPLQMSEDPDGGLFAYWEAPQLNAPIRGNDYYHGSEAVLFWCQVVNVAG